MKKSKFTDNQIIDIVAEVESGRKIADICREHGMTQATFYNWHKKYAGNADKPVQAARGGAVPVQAHVDAIDYGLRCHGVGGLRSIWLSARV